jgi:hypothetical protein
MSLADLLLEQTVAEYCCLSPILFQWRRLFQSRIAPTSCFVTTGEPAEKRPFVVNGNNDRKQQVEGSLVRFWLRLFWSQDAVAYKTYRVDCPGRLLGAATSPIETGWTASRSGDVPDRDRVLLSLIPNKTLITLENERGRSGRVPCFRSGNCRSIINARTNGKVMVDDVWGDYCAISCLGSALAPVRVIPVPFLKDIRVVRDLLFH